MDEEKPDIVSSQPDLETRPSDRLIAIAKNLSGLIPGIGPLVAQIVLDDIPGQRNDRIADYVRLLDERLTVVELESKRSDPEVIDLFEEGAYQSTRATTQDRRARIASVVAHGLKGDEAAQIEAKRLLALMQEVDDDQIVIMLSYLHRHLRDQEFHQTHSNVLSPVRASMNSDRDSHDRAVTYELARTQLVQLGLLQPNFSKPKKGEIPEFDDKTGMVKSSGRELTQLGRLLLRRCELIKDDEF